MKHNRIISVLLPGLIFLLLVSGCGAEHMQKREPVAQLQCVQPAALSSLRPASGAQVAVSWADYETERTTVLLADVNRDTVCQEITLDGVWDLKEQAFSDGRFALCQRETNTWRFLSASLEDLGTWSAESVDGYSSYDGST